MNKHNVTLLGTTARTIRKAEDRLEFKETMEKIGEPCAASLVVENVRDGADFAGKIGYPVVLRPAYTLGGSGAVSPITGWNWRKFWRTGCAFPG